MAFLNISDVGSLIKEVKKTYKENCEKFMVSDTAQVFVANSGGKDSGATDLLANEITEGNFRSVACDTGNEHPWTIEHLKTLHLQRGGRPVEIVRAEFPESAFETRRGNIVKSWQKKQTVMAGAYRGIRMPSLNNPNSKFNELWKRRSAELGWGEFETPLEACLSVMHRTDNPFLDLSLIHGGFPLGRQRFCTQELKIDASFYQVYQPALENDDVVVWTGVRADESEKRAKYKRFEPDLRSEHDDFFTFLPIHSWTARDVFALYKYFGVNPNPLYKSGMGRVGCMPCILSTKEEIAEIAARFPDEINRIEDWERKVCMSSRWIHWMIVGHVNRRQFKTMVNKFRFVQDEFGCEIAERVLNKHGFKFGDKPHFKRHYVLDAEAYRGTSFLGPRGGIIGGNVRDTIEWSRTGRGGKVYDMITALIDAEACSSKYGLCE